MYFCRYYMLIKKQIKRYGGSLGILIPKTITEELNLFENDKVLVNFIKKVEDEKQYKCRMCGYTFVSSFEDTVCPACGCEVAEENNEE